ncbi:ChaN family lipoprotein [Leptolyngbya sp. DQ-M1]|uniref:ChaN family lipoprotein n=1 Tax=Leptolyngbya sp. DQ-M1 TaxID=2933920 RepID=UPI00329A5446
MTRKSIANFCALSLSLFVLWTAPSDAQTLPAAISVSTPTQQRLDPQAVLKQLRSSRVIYLGETHDSEADHRAQLEIVRSLYQQNPKIAIGMEMFQRPFQSGLDRYLAGASTETMLREFTEYDKRWGFPWEFYSPIVNFAKQNQLPVIALNTPTEVTRKVARQGLESLTEAEKRYIPPIAEIRAEPGRYRDRLRELFNAFHSGKGRSRGFERFFQAQVLWDETMADAIAQFLNQNPDRQMIVLVGQGHIVYGEGIPDRVARRIPQVKQSTVLLNPPAHFLKEEAIADFFWKTR